ncbi:hypothetical protein RvY_04460 [Ramazzottius varieornatus]|uniref:Uncharacterized protein n=1 Tax=Ramazzottius varieornatus TaxID=947166 RepID=A0A1D1URR5_RAMVA|nr:hypothetical protein RvY_04460 [Ramazzottius varieornatus]
MKRMTYTRQQEVLDRIQLRNREKRDLAEKRAREDRERSERYGMEDRQRVLDRKEEDLDFESRASDYYAMFRGKDLV